MILSRLVLVGEMKNSHVQFFWSKMDNKYISPLLRKRKNSVKWLVNSPNSNKWADFGVGFSTHPTFKWASRVKIQRHSSNFRKKSSIPKSFHFWSTSLTNATRTPTPFKFKLYLINAITLKLQGYLQKFHSVLSKHLKYQRKK